MSNEPPADFDGVSIPSLVEYLEHDDARVRADAACALGDRLRTRGVAELELPVRHAIAALIKDREPFVRFEAAIALAESQDHRGTAVLLVAIRKRSLRLDAIRALGTMGDPAAVEPLRALMTRWLMPWADRLQAAAALCALRETTGSDYLESMLTSRRLPERGAAIHFLGESRHPKARPLLVTILADRSDAMRDVAARSLGLLGDPATREALESARHGADEELASDIDEALRRLPDTDT